MCLVFISKCLKPSDHIKDYETVGTCSAYKIFVEKSGGKTNLEDYDIDGSMILNIISDKYGGRMWEVCGSNLTPESGYLD